MTNGNVFEKIHVDERNKADLGSVLEQLNLPPAFIEFVKRNQRAIYIIVTVITVAVVAWALYDSYIEKQKINSISALAVANTLTGDEKLSALQKVVQDFSTMDAALWANIEISRNHINNAEFDKAAETYSAILSGISPSNPAYALVAFGLAQAEERRKNLEKATEAYALLKTIAGYESIAYTGIARIYEVQGKIDEAIKEFEQYLGLLIGEEANAPEKAYIEEKLSRLKAAL